MRAPIRPTTYPSVRVARGLSGSDAGLMEVRTRGGSRRGVSFLEVVLGVALLGLVAGTLSVTVSAVGGSFRRQQDRLAAAEIASRLLLMRADDEDSLPGPNAEIPYGERSFRWMIEERPVQVVLSEPAREAAMNGTTGGNTLDLSRRIVAVTVTAWLSEFSGGSAGFNPDVPHYTLTRLIDPIAFTTSDSAEERLKDQESIEDYMANVVGSMSSGDLPLPSGGGSRSGTTQRGTQPAGEPQRGRPQSESGGGGG